MKQQQFIANEAETLQIKNTAARFKDFVLVAFDCQSLREFQEAVDYPEQSRHDKLPWIVKNGRFEVLQYKNGDAIATDKNEPFPPSNKQKKTTFCRIMKRNVSDLLFWVTIYKNAGNGFTPDSLIKNLFPWLDYGNA